MNSPPSESPPGYSPPEGCSPPMLGILHRPHSPSEQLVWLCEELSIRYGMQLHSRPMIRIESPDKTKFMYTPEPIKAPFRTILLQDVLPSGRLVALAGPRGCLEYIIRLHGGGRLMLHWLYPAYADFVCWFDWATTTWQSTGMGKLKLSISRLTCGADVNNNPLCADIERSFAVALADLEGRLTTTAAWLTGNEFTAADIMVVQSLMCWRSIDPDGFSLAGYDAILAYLVRATKREACTRAMARIANETALAESSGTLLPW